VLLDVVGGTSVIEDTFCGAYVLFEGEKLARVQKKVISATRNAARNANIAQRRAFIGE